SARQADALAAYHAGRRAMVDNLGIDPSPTLQELERAILRQDESLLIARPAARTAMRELPLGSIVVAPLDSIPLDGLLAIAEPLARSTPARELILVRLVGSADLASASRGLQERSNALATVGIASRAAVFTADNPGAELTRLAGEQRADLVLLDAPI